jgi:hypothetical protein
MGELRNAYKILVGKPEQKRPPGRHVHRLKNNIRTELREVGWEVVELIHVAQDRDQWRALVNTIINLQVP